MLLFSFVAACTVKSGDIPILMPVKEGISDYPLNRYEFVAPDKIKSDTGEIAFFTDDYCVPLPTQNLMSDVSGIKVNTCFLYDLTDNTVIMDRNTDDKIYPASTTKLLTALTMYRLLEEQDRSLDDVTVIRRTNGGIERSGAKLCGFKKGDRVSLRVLLNALLVYSGNDAAIAIAEELCTDTAAFVDEMNRVAKEIGALHTNFLNPHGLHEAGHYTTAYDMYLIFRECLKYDSFLPIVGQKSYLAVYTDSTGQQLQKSFESTNLYLNGEFAPPAGIKMLGGKTGSTSLVGDCFVALSEYNGHQYLSAVFGAVSKKDLYSQMNYLLNLELSDTK